MPKKRTATVRRETRETKIAVEVNLDGTGVSKLSLGLPFLEHMLDQVARHGMVDLRIEAKTRYVPRMQVHTISQLLAGAVREGERVTVEGWVRTRRDSKAGVTFIHVLDGSTVDPLQVVVGSDVANYERDILRITSGCAIRAAGPLVSSQGKGQAVEVKAESVEIVGWVEDPETYPVQAKRRALRDR